MAMLNNQMVQNIVIFPVERWFTKHGDFSGTQTVKLPEG